MHLDRRDLLIGGLAFACVPVSAEAASSSGAEISLKLSALETRSGGKLGVALLDTANGRIAGHRLDERFTMCSTFKLSLAACVLARMQTGEIAADATLPIAKDDPVGHSPAVRKALASGRTSMTVIELAEVAQTVSDNGAANILLRKIGGPAALTRFWRTLGDKATRLDRYEPALNTSHDGDPRDTTTPYAMAGTLRAIFTGPTLSSANRNRLIDWTIATQTGLKRLRAGLPGDWRAGDKTGTMNGADYADKYNDIAILWRPGKAAPLIVTAYFEAAKSGPDPEGVLAEVGRIVAG